MWKYLLFVLILAIPYSNAANITTEKGNYYQEETISGHIILDKVFDKSIDTQQFGLYDSENNKINIGLSLLKLDKHNYFYYFNLNENQQEGIYNIIVKNIVIEVNGVLTKSNISNSFFVNKSNFSISIDPAILVLENIKENNFFVVELKNNLNPVIVEIGHEDFVKVNSNKINFSQNSSYQLQTLFDKNYNYKNGINGYVTLNYYDTGYRIPIFVKAEEKSILKTLVSANEKEHINLSIYQNETTLGPLRFKNTGNIAIDSINAALRGDIAGIIKLENSESSYLGQGNEIEINVFINKNKDAKPGYYSGHVVINYDENLLEYPVYVSVLERLNKTEFSNQSFVGNATDLETEKEVKEDRRYIRNFVFIGILALMVGVFVLIKIIKRKKRKTEENKFEVIISKYLKR